MVYGRRNTVYGLTLIEIMAVVAIIAVLASIVISVASRLDMKGKEGLTESTFAVINAALGQFGNYKYKYNNDYRFYDGVGNVEKKLERDFFVSLKFPPDCNDPGISFIGMLEKTLGLVPGGIQITGGTYNPEYSGCEVMYFFLNRVPECRETLEKIDSALITNTDVNGNPLIITINPNMMNSVSYPLYRVIDSWGTTLRYDYYDEWLNLADRMETIRAFPVLVSAGPDKVFGTADDMRSR
jgi:prepilin-type N-terminal cleavage/methylation domain-containing protein